MQFTIENQSVIHIVGYIMGIVGILLAILGRIIYYIFTEHKKDNDRELSVLRCELSKLRKESSDDFERVHDRIDDILKIGVKENG